MSNGEFAQCVEKLCIPEMNALGENFKEKFEILRAAYQKKEAMVAQLAEATKCVKPCRPTSPIGRSVMVSKSLGPTVPSDAELLPGALLSGSAVQMTPDLTGMNSTMSRRPVSPRRSRYQKNY